MSYVAPGAPIPANTPIPPFRDRNQKALRASQVIRLGLMNRAQGCAPDVCGSLDTPIYSQPALNPSLLSATSMPGFFPSPFNLYTGSGLPAGSLGPGMDATVPFPVAVEIWQAQQPSAVAVQQVSTMDPATSTQAGAGASVSSADISNAPQVLPMNVTPEMAAASSPQMMANRRRRNAEKSAATSDQSAGVTWGGAPTRQPGVCGQAGFNPLALVLIAGGLGAIVYAVAKK